MNKFETIALQRRWGDGVMSPTIKDLETALSELKNTDPEHPSTWLENGDGDVLEATEEGKMIYYTYDNPDDAVTSIVSFSEMLSMWLLFCRGKIAELKTELIKTSHNKPIEADRE